MTIAGVIGIILVGVVVSDIAAGLMVFMLVAAIESLPSVQGAPSTARLFGLFLVLGWIIATSFGDRDERSSRALVTFAPLLVWTLTLFLAWVLFSSLWAEDVSVAHETFFRFGLNFVLFPIVFAAIRDPRHVVWLCSVIVAGALITSSVGLLSGASDVGGRLGGGGLNPDELGALSATGVVMAAWLASTRGLSIAARLVALAAACLCALALIATETRGATVGLVAAMFAAPLLAGPGRRLAAGSAVGFAALALVIWLAAFTPASTVNRLKDYGSGGSGRSELWTIGFRMVEDKPVRGVGAGNFPISSVHYLLEPGSTVRDEYIVDIPKETHNIYLQVLSELGLVGATLFIAIIGLCVASALRAARAFRRAGSHTLENLSRGIVVALVALLVSSAFTTEVYSKQLYVMLAVGPALLAMAGRRGAQAPQSARAVL